MPIDHIMKELEQLFEVMPDAGKERPLVVFVSNHVTAQQVNLNCTGVAFDRNKSKEMETE